MKIGKRSILRKMLYPHFMMMPIRHPFSVFAPENTRLLRGNQYNYIRFDSLNPPFHYPRTHDSNIPEFQHSNWGEAPNLYRRQVSGVSVRVASYGLRVKVFHLCLLTSVSWPLPSDTWNLTFLTTCCQKKAPKGLYRIFVSADWKY